MYGSENKRTAFSFSISLEHARVLEELLRQQHFEFKTVPYAVFNARKNDVNVTFYPSGKLLIQGKGAHDFVEFILEPYILKVPLLGYEKVHHPEWFEPHVGVDESGKGDTFGPLCVAAVYVDGEATTSLLALNIVESKQIGSVSRLEQLVEGIKKISTIEFHVVWIGNGAYNRLIQKFQNLNKLLAWAHARAIESLLKKLTSNNPAFIVVDKFASNLQVVESALMEKGKKVKLIQRIKAESDPAVAAASILARYEFLKRLRELSEKWGINFPKGSGSEANEVLKKFVERYGVDKLKLVAKINFANVRRFLE